MSVFGGFQPSGYYTGISSGQAQVTADNAAMRALAAERRADKALLICEALWSLLRERDGLDEKVLIERINAVDMTDGRLDGKVRRAPVECPQCKRTSPSRFDHCMYCGANLGPSPFAR